MLSWLITLILVCGVSLARAEALGAAGEVPLVVGGRSIHVFRAPLGAYSTAERAEGARARIEHALHQPGDGLITVKQTPDGLEIELDSKPLFLVLPGDARPLAGESTGELANQAARVLHTVWREARERRDPHARLDALARVGLATLALAATLILLVKVMGRMRAGITRRFGRWMLARGTRHVGQVMARQLPVLASRLLLVLAWSLGLALLFSYVTYSLAQFALTRPAGERLAHAIGGLMAESVTAVAVSLPGLVVAVLIFLLAWLVTRLATAFFDTIEASDREYGLLNAHTATATRRIVSVVVWLFAVAMAYPYLPGSHTDAFKGLSVMVGLMVSIGASGVVGQIASGVMIVYTNALRKGEYVCIQEHEGTVTELGLFVTRLRTGLGEEIALPNAFVLGNVSRNYSRVPTGQGYVLDTTVTIGYDTPWRQVHAMLLEAVQGTPEILKEPAPHVVQTALSDFYVVYKLVTQVDSQATAARARVASDLHAAILDVFNRNGVQIMSPHYCLDPDAPKLAMDQPEPSQAGRA